MATNIKDLNQASDMISKLQSQLHTCQQQKVDAQSRLYDMVFSNQPKATEADLKSTIVCLQDELKKAILERDKAKARANEGQAEINLLKLKLSNLEKGK